MNDKVGYSTCIIYNDKERVLDRKLLPFAEGDYFRIRLLDSMPDGLYKIKKIITYIVERKLIGTHIQRCVWIENTIDEPIERMRRTNGTLKEI